MGKLAFRFSILVVFFLCLWLGLSQLNLKKRFKVEEVKTSTEERLAKLLLEIYTTNDEEADEESVQLVTNIKNRICRNNDIDSSNFKIHVIMKDEINAFALPDGHIVVYSGLIKECQNAEELAGVMGHEMAHIHENHIMKKLAREFGASVLVSLSGGTVTEIAKMITSTGYSRKLEAEADEFAVKYLIKANIDPEPMADFMYRLSTMGSELPNYMVWMSTHPGSEARAQSILDQIKDEEIIPEPVLTDEEWETLQSIHEAQDEWED